MYNLRARVRTTPVGSIRPQLGMGAQAFPAVAASQMTPSQALELIDDINTVPESVVLGVSDNICNQMVEATQPPTLGDTPNRSFMAVRDTPPDLGAPANYPADFAAILEPSVGATPTRDLTDNNALSDQPQMLRATSHHMEKTDAGLVASESEK